MSRQPTLEEWNFQVLMLTQSLVGAISGNFRMIQLLWEGDEWILKFYLEEDIEEDVEEVEDIVCQYTAYQGGGLKCRSELIVGSEGLPSLSKAGRVVFRRRE